MKNSNSSNSVTKGASSPRSGARDLDVHVDGVTLVDGQAKPLSDADDLSKGLAGAIAYQLTKRLVIDIGTARVAVDAALKDVKNG